MFTLAAGLLVFTGIALCVGRFSVDPRDVWGALAARLGRAASNQAMENVVFVIRIPRILTAMLVGASLSMSGAVYQSAFRNPLVSPDLLGVSSGAMTGAAIAVVLGVGFRLLPLFAFAGGMLAVAMTTAMPRIFRNDSNMMLVLSGIIVGGFMNSVCAVAKYMAEDRVELASIVFWQMGGLHSVNTPQLISVSPIMLLCMAVLFAVSWRLNILSFGEQEARAVGVNVPRLRGIAIVCASLLTASAICISGKVEWMGLVIPHFGRLVCGSDNTKLLPVTVLMGSLFLVIIDTVARTATSMEIPLSILTGLLGAPLFAWLIYKNKAKIE